MLIDIILDNYSAFSERTMYSFAPGKITLYKNKLYFTSASFLYKNSRYYILHSLRIMGGRLFINTNPDFVQKKDASIKSVEAYKLRGYEKHIFDGYGRLFHFLFEDTCHFTKQIHNSFIMFLLEYTYKPLFKVDLDKAPDSYKFTLHNSLLLTSDITMGTDKIWARNTCLYSLSGKRCLYEFTNKNITIECDKIHLLKNSKALLNQILQGELNGQ